MFRLVMAVALSVSLSIATVGCATDDQGPKTSSTAGLGKPGENVLSRIDPKKEGSVVSLNTNVAVSLTIRNQTKTAITVHWLDETAGDRVHYKNVKAGAEAVQQTWKDHYWIVSDKDGKALGIYKTTDKDGVIVIE